MTAAHALVIVGNGPGEVAGWAIPIASEARRLADERSRHLEIALCLPPCQFASGQEPAAAAGAGVFDHILEPRAVLRMGLGLGGWRPAAPAVLLHVGGDFWYTRRLARRWAAPAFAFVERLHVAKIHRAFRRIFVPTSALLDRLVEHGVPADKLQVTGDPRVDAIARHARTAPPAGRDGAPPKIIFLAGSRDTAFSAVFPFWMRTAAAMRSQLPHAKLVAVISPFVSPAVRQALLATHRVTLEAARIEVEDGGWPHLVDTDLALTIPGTNTLELAFLRIPSVVVLPFSLAPQIPTEGLVEWITRLPTVGPALRLFLARRYVRRVPHVALPNMRVGHRIMPELIGDITPEQVAAEGARLIRDDRARTALAEALGALPLEDGASRRILEAMGPMGTGR